MQQQYKYHDATRVSVRRFRYVALKVDPLPQWYSPDCFLWPILLFSSLFSDTTLLNLRDRSNRRSFSSFSVEGKHEYFQKIGNLTEGKLSGTLRPMTIETRCWQSFHAKLFEKDIG